MRAEGVRRVVHRAVGCQRAVHPVAGSGGQACGVSGFWGQRALRWFAGSVGQQAVRWAVGGQACSTSDTGWASLGSSPRPRRKHSHG
jgi:hypothetical protein